MNAPRFKRTVQFTLIAVLAMAGLAIWKMHHEVKLASELSAQNATPESDD